MSAAIVLYGLATGGKPLPIWAAFIAFVVFMIGTTLRVRHEETRRRLIAEEQTERLTKQLQNALENLDGCPQIVLGYRKTTISGFYLSLTGADARQVQLKTARSRHYLLTSEVIPHIANGIPGTLDLHATLTVKESGYTESADGQEAWKLYASDLWSSAHPIDTSGIDTPEGAVKAFQQYYMHTLAADQFLISVELSYLDMSGKKRYTSSAVIAWEPALGGSVEQVRQGPITAELI